MPETIDTNWYQTAKEKNPLATVSLTKREEEDRNSDFEEIKAERDYHRRFHPRWKAAGEFYNVVQGAPIDGASNHAIGLTRGIVDFGVTVMNQGQPSFDYGPVGDMDSKKVILWKSLVDYLLNQSGWKSHQERWITDLLVFGSSPIEVFNETPMRRRRFENAEGDIVEKVVRDFRRSKVGLRHLDLFSTWRNPFVSDRDDVPSGGKRIVLTHNQYVQAIKLCRIDGRPKYKNLDKIPVAPKYQLTVRYDEITDVYRIYCLPFGSGAQASWIDPEPDGNELGIPIFDKPLTRYRLTVDGKQVSGGANVPGMVPLCFGTFADQLDRGYQTHAVYGMGISQLIEGHEKMLEGLFNMTFDNLKLKNTVVLSYKSATGEQPDIDNIGYFDTGRLIPGEFTPQSLGIADVTSNQIMWEWIQNFCKIVTGFTYDQMVDVANADTAFQAGLQVRANNMRVKQRLTSLENGPLKRAGLLLLANALSEVTVEEWEDLTETQAEEIAGRILEGKETAEDYDGFEDEEYGRGRPTRRRVTVMIPVQGRKFREDFSGANKTRRLDHDSTENTLIEDPEMKGDVSYVPAVKEYLYPSLDVESVLRFHVKVDASQMLFDLKAQDSAEIEKVLNWAVNLKLQGLMNPDIEKIFREWLDINRIDPSRVFAEQGDRSPLLEAARRAASPPPDEQAQAMAVPQGGIPAPQPQGPVPDPAAAPGPPAALAGLASGGL